MTIPTLPRRSRSSWCRRRFNARCVVPCCAAEAATFEAKHRTSINPPYAGVQIYPCEELPYKVRELHQRVHSAIRLVELPEGPDNSCNKFGPRATSRRSVKISLRAIIQQGQAVALNLFSAARYAGVLFTLFVRFLIYVILLLPAFLRIGWTHFNDKSILRGIRYGPRLRNHVDVYCPPEAARAVSGEIPALPVLVTVMGGAWIIGHRTWNALLGSRLSEAGVIVVAVDYRNYPLGKIPEMLEDVSSAMDWVFANIESYGGDPKNVVLVGQSAGAHLTSLLLLQRCLKEAAQQDVLNIDVETGFSQSTAISWSPRDLTAFVGVSGAYDLVLQCEAMESRGIYPFIRNLCVDGDLASFSPMHVIKEQWCGSTGESAARRMPPVHLFHGKVDVTVPFSASTSFAERLRAAGVANVRDELKDGVTHTQPILEGPFSGCDYQVQLLLEYLLNNKDDARRRVQELPNRPPLVPRPVLNLAVRVMPF